MRSMLLAASLCVAVGSASAADLTMVCKNSRREYQVVYDAFARSLIAKAEEGDTPYRVDDVKTGGGSTMISGATTADGPRFKAQIGKTKSITFFEGGKVLQVDRCR